MTFNSELREISNLVDILESEHDCLLNRNLGQIKVIDAERFNILHKLSAYSERRYRWLAKAGFMANESGMSEWLLEEDDAEAQDAWFASQELLVKAKVLNRANIILINRYAQQTAAERILVAA
jgi:flagella synthesis protein FlgN